jgi:D-alanine-D-alanine ligase
MVNTNTYVRNVEGVNQLGNLLKKHLSTLGFAYESIPQIEVGNILFFTNSDNDNYDILLLGNLDNRKKFADIEYFSRTEQKLFGSGIWEHKGGLTVLLAALQALRFTRHLKKYKIGILLTTDDSLQGKFARKVVAKKSQSANCVIGLHGASLKGSVVNSRSGAAVYQFDINLKKNSIAENVSKAAAVFTSIINSWIDLSNKQDGLVISPHQMTFNSNITEPYAHGEASLSVRFNNNSQLNKIDEKIRRQVNRRQNSNLHLHIEGGERRPAMASDDNDEFLWTKAKTIAEKLDIQLSKEHRWSSADICFVNDAKYKLDGFGPIGNKPLKKPEYILKHSLLERAALLAMLIYEIKK